MAEPYFAPIGEVVRQQYGLFVETWVQLATSDTTSSKVFAIVLGYSLDILIMAIYLNVLTFGSVKSAGRAVRNAMRQQLLVLKVSCNKSFLVSSRLNYLRLGCNLYHHRTCRVPSWLRRHARCMFRLVASSWQPQVQSCISYFRTSHGCLLPLGDWYNVHVSCYIVKELQLDYGC